jgi:tRNA modification GTPase
MDLHSVDDTIAAVSTPPGHSGIGIVRMSGPGALNIADRLFRPANPAKVPSNAPSFSTAYGHVVRDGQVVDEVILTVMRAPRTYTTQDVVEINCHGGIVPLRRTLELVLELGARLADPGEFTKRAFLLGRIDLVQAEAALDVILAQTDEAQKAAARQLEGALSGQVNALRDGLVETLAHLEASIDFGDEDVESMGLAEVEARLGEVAADLERLIAGASVGRILRDGLRAAIVGRPNVGKSSLMNALLGHERVIVTHIPGTTRDVVQESVHIAGVPVVLSDTAGLRPTEDPVESIGVARSRDAFEDADLALVVLDGSVALTAEDTALLAQARGRSALVVLNKSDLPQAVDAREIAEIAQTQAVSVSALTGDGLEDLRQTIADRVWSGATRADAGSLVTNVRHKQALERAAGHVQAGRDAIAAGLSEEYVAADVRDALDALGEIVGLTLTEDVIDRIFSTFCIGK